MSELMIVANSKNWEPERSEVEAILAKAKAKGLRTDWKYCLVHDDRALNFEDETDGPALVFYKGEFMTEDEYMDMPADSTESARAEVPKPQCIAISPDLERCQYVGPHKGPHSWVLGRMEGQEWFEPPAAQPKSISKLCLQCRGNGTIKISGGMSVCHRCHGNGEEPKPYQPPDEPVAQPSGEEPAQPGIPKIPDSPDTRHAVAAEASELRTPIPCNCAEEYSHHCMKCGGTGYLPMKKAAQASDDKLDAPETWAGIGTDYGLDEAPPSPLTAKQMAELRSKIAGALFASSAMDDYRFMGMEKYYQLADDVLPIMAAWLASQTAAAAGGESMNRLEISTANCCTRIFKHKTPDECTSETPEERLARLESMRENIRQFLSRSAGKQAK